MIERVIEDVIEGPRASAAPSIQICNHLTCHPLDQKYLNAQPFEVIRIQIPLKPV